MQIDVWSAVPWVAFPERSSTRSVRVESAGRPTDRRQVSDAALPLPHLPVHNADVGPCGERPHRIPAFTERRTAHGVFAGDHGRADCTNEVNRWALDER